MRESDFVKSLQRGLSILEAFTPEFPKLRFQELVLKTKLPKATVSRFMHTLTRLNYIAFEPESRCYFLAPRVMSLGFAVISSMDLRDIALPYMMELSRLTGQNVNMAVLDNAMVLNIERIRRQQILNINVWVGSRVNSYQTSIGRAILAFLSSDRFQRVLNALLIDPEARKFIGQNGEKLIEVLNEVRGTGYALSDEEFSKGLRAIAAPVFDHKGNVEAAINVSVFAYSVSREELIEKYVPLLLNTTRKISAARGNIKA